MFSMLELYPGLAETNRTPFDYLRGSQSSAKTYFVSVANRVAFLKSEVVSILRWMIEEPSHRDVIVDN